MSIDKEGIRQRLRHTADVANGGDEYVSITAADLLSLYENLWAAQDRLKIIDEDNMQLRGLLAAKNVDEYTLECLRLAQGASGFFEEQMRKANQLISDSKQQEEIWFRTVTPPGYPENSHLIKSYKGAGNVGPFYANPIPSNVEAELELHRADYKAIRDAGFESPGELLAAYTYALTRREPDDCDFCQGSKGGVKGNENVRADGKVFCDYCDADGTAKQA